MNSFKRVRAFQKCWFLSFILKRNPIIVLLFIRTNSDIQTCSSKSMLSCRLHLPFSWQIQDIKGYLLSKYSYCILQIAFAIR